MSNADAMHLIALSFGDGMLFIPIHHRSDNYFEGFYINVDSLLLFTIIGDSLFVRSYAFIVLSVVFRKIDRETSVMTISEIRTAMQRKSSSRRNNLSFVALFLYSLSLWNVMFLSFFDIFLLFIFVYVTFEGCNYSSLRIMIILHLNDVLW